MSGKVVTSYRVSFYDVFLVIAWWPDRPDLPPAWSLWNESYVLQQLLDSGRGDPPAWHFPLGIVPEFGGGKR